MFQPFLFPKACSYNSISRKRGKKFLFLAEDKIYWKKFIRKNAPNGLFLVSTKKRGK